MHRMKHIWIMVMLKICKHTFYTYVSRIWKLMQFTCFIRKVFATKILLSGKFSFFLTLPDAHLFATCGRTCRWSGRWWWGWSWQGRRGRACPAPCSTGWSSPWGSAPPPGSEGDDDDFHALQGGITCRAIDEPRKSSKAIDERVIIDFRDKNVVIARFRDKNGGFLFYR